MPVLGSYHGNQCKMMDISFAARQASFQASRYQSGKNLFKPLFRNLNSDTIHNCFLFVYTTSKQEKAATKADQKVFRHDKNFSKVCKYGPFSMIACFSDLFNVFPQLCTMKVLLSQQNYHIGNFNLNASKMIEVIKEAKLQSVDLVVFSELSVCGYPPRDFLEFDDFIKLVEETIAQIAAQTNGIGVLLGAPIKNGFERGNRFSMLPCLFVMEKFRALFIKHSSLITMYLMNTGILNPRSVGISYHSEANALQ